MAGNEWEGVTASYTIRYNAKASLDTDTTINTYVITNTPTDTCIQTHFVFSVLINKDRYNAVKEPTSHASQPAIYDKMPQCSNQHRDPLLMGLTSSQV